jgi:anti-sigma B factor antagonist
MPAQSAPENGAPHPGELALHVVPIAGRKVRVSAEGEVDLVTSPELERVLMRELLADRDVLLDLSRIDFIDSTGLHAIIESVGTAKEGGRALTLSAELSPHARRLMEIVGLLPVIPLAGAEQARGTTGVSGW